MLWRTERQLQLHTQSLLKTIEQRDWEDFEEKIANDYRDQWEHDRPELLRRVRVVVRYTKALRLIPEAPIVQSDGTWSARVRVEGEGEMVQLMQQRVNSLKAPFNLRWAKQSAWPWDWKLVEVRNPELELPDAMF